MLWLGLQSRTLLRSWVRGLAKWRSLLVALLAVLALSGCVRYDVGIQFDSQTHGKIVQYVELSERLTSFSDREVREWTRSLDRRARALQGSTRRTGESTVIVTIPFFNADDLEEKFDGFFNPPEAQAALAPADAVDLPQLDAKLDVRQSNFLLVLRNRLSLDLDLRALGVVSSEGSVVLTPGSLLDLNFKLQVPWGARSLSSTVNAIVPQRQGGNLVWKLDPGRINHIEAVFWLPSPIGFGAVAIGLLVAVLVRVKRQFFTVLVSPSDGVGSPQG